ncbi:MAG TPA: arabinan endo-1,5-alpha-L-arabinosidase [Prolixibacteraceae bacterium]|nr:arabinan endo-1,5-alpha-L-arabinosidase [Prolixibacteraceae bacterium]
MKALRSFVFALIGFAIGVQVQAQSIIVHDPVMIRQNNTYYVFCTGWGISVFSSPDMKNWKKEKPVFEKAPQWAVDAIPTFKGHIWAPDISFFKGEYYLYYSVSAFGKNTSCIGLATNKTLDSSDPEFKWIDQGKVIQSFPGITNWNAIDPNLILNKDGSPYLTFGSFWDGIKLVKLSPDAKSVAEDINRIPTIASRKSDPNAANPPSVDNNPVDAGGNAIEAPFVFRKENYYYLFASIDYCCKGVNSTYKMIVGRSGKLTGPYLDRLGKPMASGGGSLLLEGDENWYGVGHNAVVSFDGIDFLVFHGYDAHDEGKPKLNIRKLDWDKDGWPVVK